jgi:hypothetical protein
MGGLGAVLVGSGDGARSSELLDRCARLVRGFCWLSTLQSQSQSAEVQWYKDRQTPLPLPSHEFVKKTLASAMVRTSPHPLQISPIILQLVKPYLSTCDRLVRGRSTLVATLKPRPPDRCPAIDARIIAIWPMRTQGKGPIVVRAG